MGLELNIWKISANTTSIKIERDRQEEQRHISASVV